MAHLPENMQYEKDRLEMAQKLCLLLGQTGALLLDRGVITTGVLLRRDVHASYRAFGHNLVRLQAYPGFSDNDQAHVAAWNSFGNRELVEADLPFSPEPIAQFVVERFEPVMA